MSKPIPLDREQQTRLRALVNETSLAAVIEGLASHCNQTSSTFDPKYNAVEKDHADTWSRCAKRLEHLLPRIEKEGI